MCWSFTRTVGSCGGSVRVGQRGAGVALQCSAVIHLSGDQKDKQRRIDDTQRVNILIKKKVVGRGGGGSQSIN